MRRIWAVLILMVMLTALAGCGAAMRNAQHKSGQMTPKPVVPDKPTAEIEDKTVTDHLGRTVTKPKVVSRIVSCYYTSTSTLIALGQTDALVGIEMNADSRELYKRAAPTLLELPAPGNSKNFNIEECIALKPDLVVLPTRLKEFIPKLEEAGLTVVAVSPEGDTEFIEMIEMFGTLIGGEAAERADILEGYIRETFAFVKDANKTRKPKVYIAGNSSYLSTATGKMFQTTLVEAAGGECVSEGLTDSYWAEVSAEQIAKWNPDIIVIVQGAMYDIADVTGDVALSSVYAVKDNAVYKMPSEIEGWDYPNPSVTLGALWMLSKLQPEVYSEEDLVKDCKGFYKEFYGMDVGEGDLFE